MVLAVHPRLPLGALLAASTWACVAGDGGFLSGPRDDDADFQAALGSVMGCGTQTSVSAQEHAAAIKLTVSPMWDTLPKNRWGKVDWHMVRYAAHRYFMQQYTVLVKGLEPTNHVNESSLGTADILNFRGESILNVVLKEKVTGQGFTLDDITLMLTTLERVIFDVEAFRLEYVYWEMKHDSSAVLTASQLQTVIGTYMTIWTHQGNDIPNITGPMHRGRWHSFAQWLTEKMKFDAARNPRAGLGRAAMEQMFSFEDVHQAVGDLTKSAASYWKTDCMRMKSVLAKMDRAGTGRIPISDFYGAKADGDQRFSESEAYLRDLGALDETSTLLGKKVLLANYLQGASNCFVTTPHYMVCCPSECDELLNDIQDAVVAPDASVEEIWALVQGMSSFDDEPPALDKTLYRQLERIAQKHGGRVPLHGRLFALWLHYVFPRECPYPWKAGTASATAINQFSGWLASEEEVQAYSAQRNLTRDIASDAEREHLMAQWGEDVDLGAAPWERVSNWHYLLVIVAMLGAALKVASGAAKDMWAAGGGSANTPFKTSIV